MLDTVTARGGRKRPEGTLFRRRYLRGLTPPARLGWTLFALVVVPSFAQAHRLKAEATVRPFSLVQVETWFETGDSPRSAHVQVFRADGSLLTQGRGDERGIFVFHYDGTEPLRIVVNAGAGHRAEATVSRAMLTKHIINTATACLAPPPSLLPGPLLVPVKRGPSPAEPLADRNTGTPLGRLALGVGLLLAVAATVLVRRRMRRSRKSAAPFPATER
jgi:hypothetical protein